jgi:hypothetical protein
MKDLEDHEAELTRDVPVILETMNRASEKVNMLERHISEVQAQHKLILGERARLYESMNDRVRPYFDALSLLQVKTHRANSMAHEYASAASEYSDAKHDLRAIEELLAYGAHQVMLDKEQQDKLSRATVRVLHCQQERDRLERDCATALHERKEAQVIVDAARSHAGESMIKKYDPCFRGVQQCDTKLFQAKNQLKLLSESATAAKASYNSSISELDSINVAVHTVRRDHSKKCISRDEVQPELEVAKAVFGEESPLHPLPPPRARSPEVSPEVESDSEAKETAKETVWGGFVDVAKLTDDSPFA